MKLGIKQDGKNILDEILFETMKLKKSDSSVTDIMETSDV